MCTYMGPITYIQFWLPARVSKQKVVLFKNVFIRLLTCFTGYRLIWNGMSLSLCVSVSVLFVSTICHTTFGASVTLLLLFKHFPLLHHCHRFPVVSNCTQSTQKVFWFDGSNLYFSGFVGITTANQPSAKCKMMAMGKRLQFFNSNSNNNGNGDSDVDKNRQKKYFICSVKLLLLLVMLVLVLLLSLALLLVMLCSMVTSK